MPAERLVETTSRHCHTKSAARQLVTVVNTVRSRIECRVVTHMRVQPVLLKEDRMDCCRHHIIARLHGGLWKLAPAPTRVPRDTGWHASIAIAAMTGAGAAVSA